jgi:hypothetical protein
MDSSTGEKEVVYSYMSKKSTRRFGEETCAHGHPAGRAVLLVYLPASVLLGRMEGINCL